MSIVGIFSDDVEVIKAELVVIDYKIKECEGFIRFLGGKELSRNGKVAIVMQGKIAEAQTVLDKLHAAWNEIQRRLEEAKARQVPPVSHPRKPRRKTESQADRSADR